MRWVKEAGFPCCLCVWLSICLCVWVHRQTERERDSASSEPCDEHWMRHMMTTNSKEQRHYNLQGSRAYNLIRHRRMAMVKVVDVTRVGQVMWRLFIIEHLLLYTYIYICVCMNEWFMASFVVENRHSKDTFYNALLGNIVKKNRSRFPIAGFLTTLTWSH